VFIIILLLLLFDGDLFCSSGLGSGGDSSLVFIIILVLLLFDGDLFCSAKG
jgi:hypothetical protein